MEKKFITSSLSIIFLLLIISPNNISSVPLQTNSRWIVDTQNGQRVKLVCLNWVSHLDVVVAEGLNNQPIDEISKKIISMGFNCVRLTWPLLLATNETLSSTSVKQSFMNLGLVEALAGLLVNNPHLVDLSLIDAFKAVVTSLGDNKVMVILDNHLTKPGWCCSNFDDNGFFGDKFFEPDLWIQGLTRMATLFSNVTNVIGMSLRNELRGPKQNTKDWYKYMQKGAEAVHSANPDVLVILSGLNYDTELSFLSKKQISLSFTEKLVFEVHWYGFTDGAAWETSNPNQVCGNVVNSIMRRVGFLLEQGFPILVSEFGMDLRGTNVNDNRYFNCFMSWASEFDLDWALWTLVGSYYYREGVVGMNEFYGVLDWNWCGVRNQSFLKKIRVIQTPFQGPGLSEARPHKVILHPSTGLCVIRKSLLEPLKLGPCTHSEAWRYTPTSTLTIKGTYFCLQTDGLNQQAKLGIICSESSSKWEMISDSKMHLSSKLNNGTMVCLDVDSSKNIVTSLCKCLTGDNMCDPESQWFKLVNSTRSSRSTDSFLNLYGNGFLSKFWNLS